jgi:hypothetical protein
MSHPFEVGKTYRNRAGEYTVVAIDGDKMKIRYAGGGTLDTSVEIQARIWENIQFEKQVARTEERRRQAREARLEARRRKKRARARPKFEGFQAEDFEPKTRGIAWSTRKELGRVVAYDLASRTKGDFGYWIIPREEGVNVARKEHFEREERENLSLFFVRTDEHGMFYGLRVSRPTGKASSKRHWSAFLNALSDEPAVRSALRSAMVDHELNMDVYAMETSYGPVGRITVEDDGFLWEHETAEQVTSRSMNWEELIEYLQSLTPGKRCDLYVRGRQSAEQAIKAGAGVSKEIADIFESLVPVYDAIVGA